MSQRHAKSKGQEPVKARNITVIIELNMKARCSKAQINDKDEDFSATQEPMAKIQTHEPRSEG
jgi:hypothetical protein